jgi:hypothetical protein
MVITPALRGLFGVEMDGLSSSINLDPHLPADWESATVERLHVGASLCSLEYQRQGKDLVVNITTISGPPIRLKSSVKDSRITSGGSSIILALPPVEVAVPHGLPLPGARTSQMKVLSETAGPHSLKLELEGEAGSSVELQVRRNESKLSLHAEGGTIMSAAAGSDSGFERLAVKFGEGTGYQQQFVTLSW